MSLSLAIVSVPVSDQQRALDFYVGALAFGVVADTTFERAPGQQARWVQLSPGAGTAITLVTWFPTLPPGSMKGLVLETEDLDSTISRLSGRGVVFAHPPVEAPWARFTSFDDPDGNGWVLQEPTS